MRRWRARVRYQPTVLSNLQGHNKGFRNLVATSMYEMTCNKNREKPARKQVQVIEGGELRKKLVVWQPASREDRE